MKIITKMELQPGMILAEDVVEQGKIIYTANTEITQDIINKLNRYSLICVTIKEGIDLATTHYTKIRFDETFQTFVKVHENGLLLFKNSMREFILSGKQVTNDFLLNIYNEIAKHIPCGKSLLDFLYNMVPDEDELTFNQALNSALLAGVFADWLGMNAEAKNTLILSGFYYDIGKLQLPYNLLWKTEKLTEDEYKQIQQHPVSGYQLVSNLNLNEHIKNVVLMHHERMDGSGYPYQLESNRIDLYARYIAIIDAYTAMASPRAYRNAMTPLRILEIFEQSMEKYDVELLIPIMKNIADAQIGTNIMLNDDTIWEVLIIHPNHISRPILKNDKNEILDLLDRPELIISKNL